MLGKRFQNDSKSNINLNPIQIEQRDIVNQLVSEKKYQFENVPCLICKETDFEALSEKDRYGLYHPVVICKNCGLIQNNPRMTQDSYNHFYNNKHRRLYVGSETVTETYYQKRFKAGRATAEYLRQFIGIDGKRILEVGCGSGAILKHLSDSGAIVKGIDLSEEYLQYGREKFQIDLESVDFLELPDAPKYDVIIYSDVLEHVLNIEAHLCKVKSLLSKNGVLYIKVPGVKRTHANYNYDFLNSLQNAHVYYFTLDTLKNLLTSSGFELVHDNEDIRSIWRVNPELKMPFGISDYDSAVKYLKKLELTRHLGPVAKKTRQKVLKAKRSLEKAVAKRVRRFGKN